MLEVKDLSVFKSSKIIDFSECSSVIEHLKKDKKKIGLCHGGFDLLHPGHIRHFESAKRLCDVLIVSVTADEFVTDRKGSGRPIFFDKLRAYMIANLIFIDYVVISRFKTGAEVINLLKPSFYIKGPDFINKTTPGITAEREMIKKVGGMMKYTDDLALSTTAIINYIKNKIDQKHILVIIDRDGTLIQNNDFFGKNEDWKNVISFNEEVISFLSFLKTKFKTTFIVVTNQAGVARKLFDCARVVKINNFINRILNDKGILIEDWQYCPDVDQAYAEDKKDELEFDQSFVKKISERKPSVEMVFKALKNINKKVDDFDTVWVLGDRIEDKMLAENLKSNFIDVKDKTFEQMKQEFISK